jgi:hypothetical protein
MFELQLVSYFLHRGKGRNATGNHRRKDRAEGKFQIAAYDHDSESTRQIYR